MSENGRKREREKERERERVCVCVREIETCVSNEWNQRRGGKDLNRVHFQGLTPNTLQHTATHCNTLQHLTTH